MMADEPLGDRGAGVVRDNGGLLEAERCDEVGHDPRHSRQRQVYVLAQGARVGAERQVGHDAAVLARQPGGDVAPQVAVHPYPVDEHDRRAAPALPVVDRPGRDVDRS
jgi:hypothetical protein